MPALCLSASLSFQLYDYSLWFSGIPLSKFLLLSLTPQASALQRIQVVHSFDIFQMLDMLQDLRGTMAQQVSLLICLFLLYPDSQVSPVWGRCLTTDYIWRACVH